MSNYERIARVIRYLDGHYAEQPRLDTLAQVAGLSPFHFHRLFSAWAGVTPNEFLRSLTLAHARVMLQAGNTVMDAALGAGLSGPGRLHDLCLRLEAAAPGELKSGGRGWTLTAGFSATPFGTALVAEGPRGVCHIGFCEDSARRESWAALAAEWAGARLQRDDAAAADLAARIFVLPGAARPRPALRAFVRGTTFQVRVWRALLAVEPGTLVSYGGLAAAAGAPGAARAVGTAMGRNPLAWLIPCHRVIRETGVVGDYRWGQVRKRAMLAWESAGAPQFAVQVAQESPGPGARAHSSRR